ncbi:MAG: hypothetical protein ABEJ36_00530, partial [Candidatus Nanosalina sp.]
PGRVVHIFLACKVEMHLVDESGNMVDGRYTWPGIYNDRLKYTFTSSLGPYWIHQVETREDLWDPRKNF